MPLRDPAARKAADKAYRERNKEKIRATNKVWVAANPGKVAARQRRYRIGSDGLDLPREVCGICEVAFDTLPPTHVQLDHDHTTGVARGWLCLHCNTGLGRFRDDPARLRAAADYLEKGN